MRRRRGCYVFACGGARGSAKRGGGGASQRVARLQPIRLLDGAASFFDFERFGSQMRYVQKLASRSGTGISDGVSVTTDVVS
jgi:hypothetical protein